MLALLAATSMLSIQAQEKAISAAEFAVLERAADAPFQAKQTPARWTIATESRIEGRPQTDYVSQTVMEFGPNRSQRRSSQSSFGGGPLKRETVIKIGDKKYIRADREEWKEAPIESGLDLANSAESDIDITELHVEYKYLGSGVLNGKKVRMYLRNESRKETAKSTGAVSEAEVSTKYWFGESSDLYRSEYRSTRTGDKTFHTNITIEKELDPSISISAP